MNLRAAVTRLRAVQARNDEVIRGIIEDQTEVLAKFQPMFAPDQLSQLTEEEFRRFLLFRENKHWDGIQRHGPRICEDMGHLRSALEILLDESRPIVERLDQLIPPGSGPSYVPYLNKAILTPILLVAHPERYTVWNRVSEQGLRAVNLWPAFDRGTSFGRRYDEINRIQLSLAKELDVDPWTLDALWWGVVSEDSEDGAEAEEEPVPESPALRFGLERHLHEFLLDNWNQTELGREWALHAEDNDPEAGYEYVCDIGRIDLLARHRQDGRWLVVELKRDQTSDATVGQVLRYMAWVRRHLAGNGEEVEGLVITRSADKGLCYALTETPGVAVQLYEVDFHLRTPAERPGVGT